MLYDLPIAKPWYTRANAIGALPDDTTTAGDLLQLLEFWQELRINLDRVCSAVCLVKSFADRLPDSTSFVPGWTAIIADQERTVEFYRDFLKLLDPELSGWSKTVAPVLPGFRHIQLRAPIEAPVNDPQKHPPGTYASAWGQISKEDESAVTIAISRRLLLFQHERIEAIIAREAVARGLDTKPFIELGIDCRQFDPIPDYFCLDQNGDHCRLPDTSLISDTNLKRRLKGCFSFCRQLETKLCAELWQERPSPGLTNYGKKIESATELMDEYDLLKDDRQQDGRKVKGIKGIIDRVDHIGRNVFEHFDIFENGATDEQIKNGINRVKTSITNKRNLRRSKIKRKSNRV